LGAEETIIPWTEDFAFSLKKLILLTFRDFISAGKGKEL
jgi:hypothetical protein